MSHTRSQKVARAAFVAVEAQAGSKSASEYLTFARQFPTLIHTCGLAQATAFALAKGAPKKPGDKPGATLKVLDDLATVLGKARGYGELTGAKLHQKAIDEPVLGYLRITRDALFAAGWLKRYAEALLPLPEEAAG